MQSVGLLWNVYHKIFDREASVESNFEHASLVLLDFVEMLEYGMPPACGMGYSERVFWIFEGVTAREGVPFPQLRPEYDAVTRSIYPDVDFDAHDGPVDDIKTDQE